MLSGRTVYMGLGVFETEYKLNIGMVNDRFEFFRDIQSPCHVLAMNKGHLASRLLFRGVQYAPRISVKSPIFFFFKGGAIHIFTGC